MNRFQQAVAMIDAANGADPSAISVEGRLRPAEQVYGERMSAMLISLTPDASELLGLAVRAQHIRRWMIPRSEFPMDRAGYYRWRNEAKRRHAEWAGEIMSACGYSVDDIARVGALIRKENLRGDAEAQRVEDVACLVFLKHYSADFASKHEAEKVVAILRKTWSKMSEPGRAAARELALAEPVRGLLAKALQCEGPSQ